jgi:eukaryotic-like serine/threonine-protein kinase
MDDSENTSGLEPGRSPAAPPAPAAPPSPAADRSRRWLWIILGIAAALVVVAIVLIGVRFGGGVEVPDLAGLSVPEATSALEAVGLVIGDAVYTDGLPTGVVEGDIVGQLPPAGAQAEKGTKVDVIVARGGKVATIPDVVVGLPRR